MSLVDRSHHFRTRREISDRLLLGPVGRTHVLGTHSAAAQHQHRAYCAISPSTCPGLDRLIIVVAEAAGAQPLIANRDAIGPWEEFDLIEL